MRLAELSKLLGAEMGAFFKRCDSRLDEIENRLAATEAALKPKPSYFGGRVEPLAEPRPHISHVLDELRDMSRESTSESDRQLLCEVIERLGQRWPIP